MRPVGANEYSFLAHPVDDVRRFGARRLQRCLVADQLDSNEEPGATDIADERASRSLQSQASEHSITDSARVLHETFLMHDTQDFQSDDRGHRAPAKGREELHAVVEARGDFRRRDYGADGISIADRLAEHDDVRHDALLLESPEVRAN